MEKINCGDLLKNQAARAKDSSTTSDIQNKSFVNDDMAIDAVKQAVSDCEKSSLSWIMNGFPRTKFQALALQSMGIVPDRIIHLSAPYHIMQKGLREQFGIDFPDMNELEVEERITQIIHEY